MSIKKPETVVVTHKPDAPVATEILADAIVTVSRGMKKMLTGPLGENALVLLIQDAAGGRNSISQEDVKRVLRNAARLGEVYVRQPQKKR